jgi:hypothetical protein
MGPGRLLSQRFLASKHGIERRRVKQIISIVRKLNESEPRPQLSRELLGWVSCIATTPTDSRLPLGFDLALEVAYKG